MSRDWGAYCPECKEDHAVRGFITDEFNGDSTYLIWCPITGKFWKEVTKVKEMKITGKTEKDWRKAEIICYEDHERNEQRKKVKGDVE